MAQPGTAELCSSANTIGEIAYNTGNIVSNLTQEVVVDYEDGSNPDEVAVNAALADILRRLPSHLIAQQLQTIQRDNVEFQARVLSSRTRKSEESHAGADLAISISLQFEDYVDSRSVLVQNKTYRSRNDTRYYNTDSIETESQNMLQQSTDSFIFVFPYNSKMIAIPTSSIVGRAVSDGSIPGRYPEQLPTLNMHSFFRLFVLGYIGDISLLPPSLSPFSWEDHDLSRSQLSNIPVDRVLQIQIRSKNVEPYSGPIEGHWWEDEL